MAPRKTPVPANKVAAQLLELLAKGPATTADLAARLGRPPKDATVRRRLAALAAAGEVASEASGEWSRCQRLPLPDALEGYEFPDGFDEASREEFTLKATELVAADVVIDSFLIDLLERYVRCLQRARHANLEIAEDGLFQRGAKAGSRKFAHPGVAIAREAERDAHAYGESIEKRKRKEPDGASEDGDDLAGL